MTQMTPERMALYRASAQQREQAKRQHVDLIRFEEAPATLQAVIIRTGVEL